MLPLPKNQAYSNIFQPPGNNVDGSLSTNTADQDHSLLIRHCFNLLTRISAAVDRNTRLTNSMANYIMHGHPGMTGETVPSSTIPGSEDTMHGHPGATGETAPSSTVQDPEDKNNENMSGVKIRRFRACAKPPKHKDPNELCRCISHISTNRPCCLNITAG